jgi:aminopeptidase-like protein
MPTSVTTAGTESRVSPSSREEDSVGAQMYRLIEDLYPLCRSITGAGLRETLRQIRRHVPLTVHEVPTGTPVLDWTVPREWNIRDAYVKNMRGERVIDFGKCNLHVMGYSVPIHRTMSLTELTPHLFTLPDHPDWIPFRTSFYREDWGFCLTQRQLAELTAGEYEVRIDASLTDGHLSYGEVYLPGETTAEVLISAHICHPSLCNDNLSGVALGTFLAKTLQGVARRYSYRFLFAPATIGALAWLAQHERDVARVKHGLILTCVGDSGPITYKRSRRGDAEIDRAAAHVLRHAGQDCRVREFSPYGYDERQYCSPGFDLPVGCLMRTPHGEFPEYHTSADNLDLVRREALADSFAKCRAILAVLEQNTTYVNLTPQGEPQLGKRGLYPADGASSPDGMALLWVLNQSDGRHSLLDIAERAGLEFGAIRRAADALRQHSLLASVG